MTDLETIAEHDLTETKQDPRRKTMDAIWWGGALIWFGLAMGANSLDVLPTVGDQRGWWPWVFIGLGIWSIALNGYFAMSDWPNPTTWDWVWTAIFSFIDLGAVVDLGGAIVGAVALIVIGVIFLTRALSDRT